jgi:hypothetical protein
MEIGDKKMKEKKKNWRKMMKGSNSNDGAENFEKLECLKNYSGK